MNVKSTKSKLKGEITVPGSKSHTIRAVLLAAMAEGTSEIINPLPSRDGLSAFSAAKTLGAEIVKESGKWIVNGGISKLHVPETFIDTRNSGTTTCFITAISALLDGYTFITGDHQIRRRPIKILSDALNSLGAEVLITRPGKEAPPIVVKGKMKGGKVNISGFSSQNISSLLLAAPLAEGNTEIFVDDPLEKPYIQMTLDWMKRYGIEPDDYSSDFTYFSVKGGKSYTATDSTVPADWSGVAFPLVAAAITDSDVKITGVDFDDCQGDKIVVDHLITMGADVEKNTSGGFLRIKGGTPLKGGLTINLKDIPDSLPALSVAACFAEGKTVFTDLAHVRVKETDRVAVMAEELGKLGAVVETGPDTMVIHGGHPLKGTIVNSHDDHRVAMALSVAGLGSEGAMEVTDAECAEVSFPGFFELMKSIGSDIMQK